MHPHVSLSVVKRLLPPGTPWVDLDTELPTSTLSAEPSHDEAAESPAQADTRFVTRFWGPLCGMAQACLRSRALAERAARSVLAGRRAQIERGEPGEWYWFEAMLAYLCASAALDAPGSDLDVWRAWARLAPDTRVLLGLRFLDDLSPREIHQQWPARWGADADAVWTASDRAVAEARQEFERAGLLAPIAEGEDDSEYDPEAVSLLCQIAGSVAQHAQAAPLPPAAEPLTDSPIPECDRSSVRQFLERRGLTASTSSDRFLDACDSVLGESRAHVCLGELLDRAYVALFSLDSPAWKAAGTRRAEGWRPFLEAFALSTYMSPAGQPIPAAALYRALRTSDNVPPLVVRNEQSQSEFRALTFEETRSITRQQRSDMLLDELVRAEVLRSVATGSGGYCWASPLLEAYHAAGALTDPASLAGVVLPRRPATRAPGDELLVLALLHERLVGSSGLGTLMEASEVPAAAQPWLSGLAARVLSAWPGEETDGAIPPRIREQTADALAAAAVIWTWDQEGGPEAALIRGLDATSPPGLRAGAAFAAADVWDADSVSPVVAHKLGRLLGDPQPLARDAAVIALAHCARSADLQLSAEVAGLVRRSTTRDALRALLVIHRHNLLMDESILEDLYEQASGDLRTLRAWGNLPVPASVTIRLEEQRASPHLAERLRAIHQASFLPWDPSHLSSWVDAACAHFHSLPWGEKENHELAEHRLMTALAGLAQQCPGDAGVLADRLLAALSRPSEEHDVPNLYCLAALATHCTRPDDLNALIVRLLDHPAHGIITAGLAITERIPPSLWGADLRQTLKTMAERPTRYSAVGAEVAQILSLESSSTHFSQTPGVDTLSQGPGSAMMNGHPPKATLDTVGNRVPERNGRVNQGLRGCVLHTSSVQCERRTLFAEPDNDHAKPERLAAEVRARANV